MRSLTEYLSKIRSNVKSTIWRYYSSVQSVGDGIILTALTRSDIQGEVREMLRARTEIRKQEFYGIMTPEETQLKYEELVKNFANLTETGKF